LAAALGEEKLAVQRADELVASMPQKSADEFGRWRAATRLHRSRSITMWCGGLSSRCGSLGLSMPALETLAVIAYKQP